MLRERRRSVLRHRPGPDGGRRRTPRADHGGLGFSWSYAFTFTGVEDDVEAFCTDAADPDAACGAHHRTDAAALAGWIPEAMVGGQDDELLLQIARSLF